MEDENSSVHFLSRKINGDFNLRKNIIFLFIFFNLNLIPSISQASSESGIQIEFGKFKLDIYYSVAVEYQNGEDEYIRDPRKLLFELASILQSNKDVFSGIDKKILIELNKNEDNNDTILSVAEFSDNTYDVIYDGIVAGDIAKKIIDVICCKYLDGYIKKQSLMVYLYKCKNKSCPGRVKFGVIPSSSINEEYGLISISLAIDYIKTSRDQMINYFEVIEK